jgi:membrane associated rhomboid family serine protease
MGYEDRDYYREEESRRYGGGGRLGGMGLNFNKQSILIKLIMINVAVFAVDLFSPRLTAYDQLVDPPADLSTPIDMGDGVTVTGQQLKEVKTDTNWLGNFLSLKTDRPWEVWAYLTHGFTHASYSSDIGVWHLIFNMITLFFLGIMVEQKLGSQEFLKFYLVSILGGGIAWMLIQLATGSEGSIVGASGAVSAVIIYFVMLAPQSTLLLMGIIPVKAWVVGILFLVTNVFYALGASQIAWEAHLAGAAFGALYYKLGWNFERFQWPSFVKRSALKIHDPDAIDAKLQQEADRVLDKISREGEASLTRRERKTLNKYSKLIRRQRG